MKVLVRADASIEIGSGHVARCLTLAKALARRGAAIRFVCREHPGNLGRQIAAQGVAVTLLPLAEGGTGVDGAHAGWLGGDPESDASLTAQAFGPHGRPDLVIADHYAIDSRWESGFRATGSKVVVIDDLADRVHDCDVLVDQNYYRDFETRYDRLVPARCTKLLGPRYALLRDEFLVAGKRMRARGGPVDRILVFFGGTDRTNETAKALGALLSLERREIRTDVVVGQKNPHRDAIEAMCSDAPRLQFHCQTSEMARLMSQADLALGACGTATWERAYLGLPSVVVSVAANQERAASDVHDFGAHRYLGRAGEVDRAAWRTALAELIEGRGLLQMSNAARRLMGTESFVGTDGVAAHLLGDS